MPNIGIHGIHEKPLQSLLTVALDEKGTTTIGTRKEQLLFKIHNLVNCVVACDLALPPEIIEIQRYILRLSEKENLSLEFLHILECLSSLKGKYRPILKGTIVELITGLLHKKEHEKQVEEIFKLLKKHEFQSFTSTLIDRLRDSISDEVASLQSLSEYGKHFQEKIETITKKIQPVKDFAQNLEEYLRLESKLFQECNENVKTFMEKISTLQ